MNSLNSLIFEGTVTSIPTGRGGFVFKATSWTYGKDGGERIDGASVWVEIRDAELLESVKIVTKRGFFGRDCKIVGKLAGSADHNYIIAEHVEFRPLFGRNGED